MFARSIILDSSVKLKTFQVPKSILWDRGNILSKQKKIPTLALSSVCVYIYIYIYLILQENAYGTSAVPLTTEVGNKLSVGVFRPLG